VKSKLGISWRARWFDPVAGMSLPNRIHGLDMVVPTLGFRTSAMLLIAQKPPRA
jgi:hypothetical protein